MCIRDRVDNNRRNEFSDEEIVSAIREKKKILYICILNLDVYKRQGLIRVSVYRGRVQDSPSTDGY